MRAKFMFTLIAGFMLWGSLAQSQTQDIGWLENPSGGGVPWEGIRPSLDELLNPKIEHIQKQNKFNELMEYFKMGLFQPLFFLTHNSVIEASPSKSTVIEILKNLTQVYELNPDLINPHEWDELKDSMQDLKISYLIEVSLTHLYTLPHPGMFDFYEKVADRFLEEGFFLEASFYLYLLKEYSPAFKKISEDPKKLFENKFKYVTHKSASAIQRKLIGIDSFRDYLPHFLSVYFEIFSNHPETKKWFEKYKIFDFATLGRLVFYGDLKIEFVNIPKGSFWMGSPSTEEGHSQDEELHRVTLTQDFQMMQNEVTQLFWVRIMGANPSYFKEKKQCESSFRIEKNKDGKEIPVCPQLPVENVSWDDIQLFIDRLNQNKVGYTYRLPTEAQWEYAARAGTQTAYSFGDNSSVIHAYASVNKEQTLNVGRLTPNAWGLYDMHGNVWEWVLDPYSADYSKAPSQEDAQNKNFGSGTSRVFRGGSWSLSALYLRSADRSSSPPKSPPRCWVSPGEDKKLTLALFPSYT